MALAKLLFDMLVDDELDSIMEEQDWKSVRKYIAEDYARRSPEAIRAMYAERFKPAYVTLVTSCWPPGRVWLTEGAYDTHVERWYAWRSFRQYVDTNSVPEHLTTEQIQSMIDMLKGKKS